MHVPEVLVPFMGGLTFLPFVRESRLTPAVDRPLTAVPTPTPNDKKTDKSDKEKKTAAPAPALAPSVTDEGKKADVTAPATAVTTVAVSPEVQVIVDKIVAKGDEIRTLKAAKVTDVFAVC